MSSVIIIVRLADEFEFTEGNIVHTDHGHGVVEYLRVEEHGMQ